MMIKRFFDIFLSFFALLLSLPILIIISICIVLESGFPIFFRQERIGQNCKKFSIYKFRTMRPSTNNSGALQKEGLSRQELQELRKNFATTSVGDNRITRVGKFLRKTHLDELPQFLNVLFGDMSIVGPRPDTPVQEGDYALHRWKERHLVKPGITGLAQVHPHRMRGTGQRMAWDILYVNRQTFALDLWIIWRTFLKVFKANSF